jgi:L-serine dehydratase
MQSLRELYRIGTGPSSSHTMGPALAARRFHDRFPAAAAIRAELFGSLAATGRGHGTDVALQRVFAPVPVDISWRPEEVPSFHPNGLELAAFDASAAELGRWRVYSVGGGALREEGEADPPSVYPITSMADLLAWSVASGLPLWEYVRTSEGEAVFAHLAECWEVMRRTLSRGLGIDGELPGGLRLKRRAKAMLARSRGVRALAVSAFALAVMEENAAGGEVVTAPTCGSCGVVPAVLARLQGDLMAPDREIHAALATAGLVGNLVKSNASISGAEVGCQGEVGTACAMAAAAATQLLGGTPAQIEYAAEMALEHHLGLTCDPVLGLVQMPCIERNAFAATRALDCAEFALCSDGSHRISFDDAVAAMKATGRDLHRKYRETGEGGLAALRPEPAWLMGS